MSADVSSAAVRKMRCPKCHKQRLWKIGYTMTVRKGRVTRLKCQACAHSFNYDPPKPRTPRKAKTPKSGS